MIWLIQDFALLSVILRALTMILQSTVLGGMLFAVFVLPQTGAVAAEIFLACRRWIGWAAAGLAALELVYVAIDTSILSGSAHLPLRAAWGADYFTAGCLSALAAAAVAGIAWSEKAISSRRGAGTGMAAAAAALMAGSIWSSHAVSRLDHRVLLSALTVLHQSAVAGWVGALVFLLLATHWVLGREDESAVADAKRMLNRYSTMALSSAIVVIATGTWLSLLYIGSAPALYGTAYGFMVLCKLFLILFLLLPGVVNWSLTHERVAGPFGGEFGRAALTLVRRLTEFEVGIGVTIILAAASLTSQPPAVDLVQNRLTSHEIYERMRIVVPGFKTPGVEELAPATPLEIAVNDYDNEERAQAHQQRDPDIEWSEYSHHWAGIILLCIGLGAFLSHFAWGRWARHWPLGFIALAIFSFLRGDPENWPLGPISFWKSFYDPEVLMHRLYDLIFIFYAAFEWGVQTGRLKQRWAGYVFPLMLAMGGAALLLHNHALGNVKDELLIEMSHNAMGMLAVLAGMGRLLELRLPDGRVRRFAGCAWPLCLMLIGGLLLNYREA